MNDITQPKDDRQRLGMCKHDKFMYDKLIMCCIKGYPTGYCRLYGGKSKWCADYEPKAK